MTSVLDSKKSPYVLVKNIHTGIVERIAFPSNVQVGLSAFPSGLDVFGRLSISTKNYVVNSSQNQNGVINLVDSDTIATVTNTVPPSSGRIKIYLPSSPQIGQLHFIKDASGTASTTPIDVLAKNSTVDNVTLKTISSAYGTIALYWLGSSWGVLITGSDINTSAFALLSGSTFTGPVIMSGGLTSSLQQTSSGQSYLVAGSGITITSQSNGQVILNASVAGVAAGGW